MMKDKSSLLGKVVRFIGFGYIKHPRELGWLLEVSFYSLAEDEYLICVSEGPKTPQIQILAKDLGITIEADIIAPYVQKSICGNICFHEFKDMMNRIFKKFSFVWLGFENLN